MKNQLTQFAARSRVLLQRLVRLCGRYRGRNPDDNAQFITGGPHVLVDGKEIHGWGVQFHNDGSGYLHEGLERYAIVMQKKGDTRASVVRKFRILANAIETGEGAVIGENILTGHELNRAEYAAVDEAATQAKYPFDFTPSNSA